MEGVTIHSDARGAITELAFARGARLEPHQSRDSAWLCVVEGVGWVLVGDDHRQVAPGDAVIWPAGIVHAAWTDHAPMRAILVELAGPDDAAWRGILDGIRQLSAPSARQIERGVGELAPRAVPGGPAAREGEPL